MTTFFAFIFVLSLLVFVHEFGHFIVAKLSGIGVERFSIGLPPRLLGVRVGETEYCLSAIPFGGYVKMVGQDDFDYDESEDETLTSRDFRSKPIPVKIAVLAAGSIMNLLTAVVIFSLLFMSQGVPEQSSRIGMVTDDSYAAELGFKTGDEIIALNGESIEVLDQVLLSLYTEDEVNMIVRDMSGERTITSTRKLVENEDFGISPYYEARVGTVVEDSPAEKAGFMSDDVVVAIGDTRVVGGWVHMTGIIEKIPGEKTVFTVLRNGAEVPLEITLGEKEETLEDGTVRNTGFAGIAIKVATKEVGAVESVTLAADRTVYLAGQTLSFFYKLVTGQMSPKLIGGPVMIAQIAGESAKSGFATLFGFMAFISINLGVLNLLPFPVLDGGHIALYLIEAVSRRKVSVKVRMAIQQAGSIVLLLLMIYITFNDILRFDSISRMFGG